MGRRMERDEGGGRGTRVMGRRMERDEGDGEEKTKGNTKTTVKTFSFFFYESCVYKLARCFPLCKFCTALHVLVPFPYPITKVFTRSNQPNYAETAVILQSLLCNRDDVMYTH